MTLVLDRSDGAKLDKTDYSSSARPLAGMEIGRKIGATLMTFAARVRATLSTSHPPRSNMAEHNAALSRIYALAAEDPNAKLWLAVAASDWDGITPISSIAERPINQPPA